MPATTSRQTDARLRLHRLTREGAPDDFAADVRRGLTSTPKRLLPKYFYDDLGSQLFEAICLLPEYYLTRAEAEILARQPELLYRPVDISAAALQTAARVLLQDYPALRIEAYASDYDTALAHLAKESASTKSESADDATTTHERAHARTLALFLGSNVGNFDPAEAAQFLARLRAVLQAGDALLLGADLKKDPARLVAAYDDALGVTAAFNLNLLARLNREFGADFDLRAFRHVAIYNEQHGRIELYLESRRAQTIHLPALEFAVEFAAGERVHTENSYKYDLADIDELAARTGFARTRTWMDEAGQFSSNLLLAV